MTRKAQFDFVLAVKHNTCEGENAFGITWKETKPANFAARSCPREAKGNTHFNGNKKSHYPVEFVSF